VGGDLNSMILVRTNKVGEWLKAIDKKQTWLAISLRPENPYSRAYISQVLNNRCQISNPMIDKLLSLSHLEFDKLFYRDGEDDSRRFYGVDIWWRGKMWTSKEYSKEIDAILSIPRNGNNYRK